MIDFADDTTLITRHKDGQLAVSNMQIAVNNVVEKYWPLGLEVSETKAKG